MSRVAQHGEFGLALEAIPACSLDAEGVTAQKARYRAIAPFVTGVGEEPMTVVVECGDGLDLAALDEVVAVEHQCCGTALSFELDRPNRSLRVTAVDPADFPALELIAAGFRQRLAR